MAKKGKAKNGAAPTEADQAPAAVPVATVVPVEPARPVVEKPAPVAPVKEVKVDVKPVPEKKIAPPKPEQTNGATGNGSDGESGEMKRKRSRRSRKKKATESDDASDQQPKEKASSAATVKKNLRKKRSKLMRALEQAESTTSAPKAGPEGKALPTAEDIRKKIQIVENLLQHLQAQTQEEQKKVDSLTNLKPEQPEPQPKKEQASPKNLTSEKARKDAEVKKLASEKVEIQNEAKRLAQERARKEQEMRKLIEEKAKKDAEAKQLLEEKAAREAELAKLNQAKARVETVEQKINEIGQKAQQRTETEEAKVAPGSPKQKKEQARTRKDSESSKKKEAEDKVKKEAEEKAKKEAAEKAKKEAEEKAKKEAAEKAKKEAEEKAKKEAAEKAKKEAEEKAKKEAAEKAKKEAEEKAKKEAAEKAKKEAEEKAKKEAAEKAKKEAEEKAKKEAAEKAKKEAEEKAKKEAVEKAKKEAEEKAKKEAAEKAKKEAEEKAKKEAEEKAKKEAAEKAKKEAEEKAKKEAAEKAKKEAEEKAKKEAAEKAKREAEEKAKKEAAEKAKKEAEEKAKKEAAEKAKKEAEEKAKKEAAEKSKKEAEEKAKKEAAEKARKDAEEKLKQEAAEKAKKQTEEEAKRKANGEAAKQQNGSTPTTQDKPAAPKQDPKNNKKNNKRTPKNSVSEDEKGATKATGSKNGPGGDFASSAEPVSVAKSQEAQSAPVPIPKTPEVASPAVSPKVTPKPANGKPAVPANGKQQTPPSKTPEKTAPPQPKTAARASPPKTTAKAPSPPKTAPAPRASPKPPGTPPASKKPDPPPKPEFLKRKSPSVEKEKVVKAPTVAAPTPAPTAAATPSSAAASPAPVTVPAPAPVSAPVSAPAPEGATRLTEEALNGTKKPAAAGAAGAGAGAAKGKPAPQKKPEVPPKPDVHNKSAAKMKTPIKQPGGKSSTVTKANEPAQHNHMTTIQSDSRSPAPELSRSEAFKKNMDIISTIADVLLSYPRSKRNRAETSNANEPSGSSTDTTAISTSLASTPASSSLFSSLFPSLPSSFGTEASTSKKPPSEESGSKQKSKLDLERILRILQSSQAPPKPGSASEDGQTATPAGSGSASKSPAMPPVAEADENPLGSFLSQDAIRMLMPTLQEVNVKFNVEKQLEALNATAAMAKLLPKTLPPGTDTTEEDELEEDLLDEEEEDTIEYKFTPRPVFIATICQVCKNPLKSFFHCERCMMVSYCGDEHRRADQQAHRDLCEVLSKIAANRGGHLYQLARKLNVPEYRNLRVHTLNQIELDLQRPLLAFEREIVLFPRICLEPGCREWRQDLLTECTDCRQVSFCAAHPTHLPATHRRWCKAYLLFQKLILRQRILGRIEPVLPTRIITKPAPLPVNIDETFKHLYKNSTALRDECVYAVLSQIATAPLSALHAFQQTGLPFGNSFTIHLVGAELQFEGDTLDKWEAFFLHLVPEVAVLRVVFVGPELNVENLPIDVISRIRMCRTCRTKCRVVAFDFQCRTMYHDYRHSSRYQRPNLICFFNPGLHRTTGYAGLDTWPLTIRAATEANCPMLVTAYTELESPLDLERLQRESTRTLKVVQPPSVNPFGSKRPDRNFISDETAPMIFKNYYYFLVQ